MKELKRQKATEVQTSAAEQGAAIIDGTVAGPPENWWEDPCPDCEPQVSSEITYFEVKLFCSKHKHESAGF